MKDLDILLVEDNPGDIRLTREALKERPTKHRLHVVEDGDLALDFLQNSGVFADAPRPDLILLDLNLPKRSGFEVLKVLKSDANLKVIPVVILSTSTSPDDIIASYQHHVNCYVSKPVNYQDFMGVILRIEEFWAETVRLVEH